MTPEQVWCLLDELGASADEVAAVLLYRGIRGKIQNAESCPIANFLGCKGLQEVDVHSSALGYLEGICTWAGDDGALAPLPPGVRDFIVEFDNGEHPELVEAE